MSIQYIFVFGGKIIHEGKTDVKTPVIKTNIPAFPPGVWNPVKAGPGATHDSPAAVDTSQDPTAHARKSLPFGCLCACSEVS